MKNIFLFITISGILFTSCYKDDNDTVTTGNTTLTGTNVVPAVTTSATGKISFSYNANNKIVTYQLEYSNLTDSAIQFVIDSATAGQTLPSFRQQTVNFGSHPIEATLTWSGANVLTGITLVNGGSGNTATSFTFGQAWASGATYTAGQQVFQGNNLYTVTTAGTSGTLLPSHTSGAVAATGGTATLTYAGLATRLGFTNSNNVVTAASVAAGGSGSTTAFSTNFVLGTFTKNFQRAKSGTYTGNFIVDGQRFKLEDLRAGKYTAYIRTKAFPVNGELRGQLILP
jgi:CHRD domain